MYDQDEPFPLMNDANKVIKNMMMKIIKIILAISADPSAMSPRPKIPARMAMTKKTIAYVSKFAIFFQ